MRSAQNAMLDGLYIRMINIAAIVGVKSSTFR